jgi:NDP-sugar pyrophosphorylase family protein
MKPTLVVLAAGIGSRYGGIKQLDGFGPNQERIIDYTIFDAIEVGYDKIVFVIRKAIEDPFRELIVERWQGQIDIRLVFQELDSLPAGYTVPHGREKPWGTAHAVWMAEKEVNEPFAIVNADDFYGRHSLKVAYDFLQQVDPLEMSACMVGYLLKNTITDAGHVSRGVCEANDQNHLTSITERTKIVKGENGIFFEEEGIQYALPEETIVSMNLMGFSPKVFATIAEGFDAVYQDGLTNLKKEYYIPSVLNEWIIKDVKVPLLKTVDQWFGVTYAADKPWVTEQLALLHEAKVYPPNLWE